MNREYFTGKSWEHNRMDDGPVNGDIIDGRVTQVMADEWGDEAAVEMPGSTIELRLSSAFKVIDRHEYRKRLGDAAKAVEKQWASRDVEVRLRELLSRGCPRVHARKIAEESLEASPYIEAVEGFLTGDKTILVLSGGVGCGKTQAACMAFNLASDVLFVRAGSLNRISMYDAEEMARLHSASVLIIDDVGIEYADRKGFLLALLDDMIDPRYSEGRHTIITTNLLEYKNGEYPMKKRLGDRLMSRIAGNIFGAPLRDRRKSE